MGIIVCNKKNMNTKYAKMSLPKLQFFYAGTQNICKYYDCHRNQIMNLTLLFCMFGMLAIIGLEWIWPQIR